MRQVLLGQLKYTTWVTASATSDAIPYSWNVLASSLSKFCFSFRAQLKLCPWSLCRGHLAWTSAPLGSHCSSLVPSGLVWFPCTDPKLCENRNRVLNYFSVFHSRWHDAGLVRSVQEIFIMTLIAFTCDPVWVTATLEGRVSLCLFYRGTCWWGGGDRRGGHCWKEKKLF